MESSAIFGALNLPSGLRTSCLTADALLCKLMDAIPGLLRDDRNFGCRYHILHNLLYVFIEDVRLQNRSKLAFCASGRHLDRLGSDSEREAPCGRLPIQSGGSKTMSSDIGQRPAFSDLT